MSHYDGMVENEKINFQRAEIERLTRERNGYKEDLDRVAAAVYPQKQDRFTYSVDFMIEAIQKSRRENAALVMGQAEAMALVLSHEGHIEKLEAKLAAAEADAARSKHAD